MAENVTARWKLEHQHGLCGLNADINNTFEGEPLIDVLSEGTTVLIPEGENKSKSSLQKFTEYKSKMKEGDDGEASQYEGIHRLSNKDLPTSSHLSLINKRDKAESAQGQNTELNLFNMLEKSAGCKRESTRGGGMLASDSSR